MSIGRSLKADVIFYLAGTGIYAASQWLLVVIYARESGPEGVGLFAIATAIAAPIRLPGCSTRSAPAAVEAC